MIKVSCIYIYVKLGHIEYLIYKKKMTQAEQDKKRCERIHEEKSKLYQEYEQQRIKLSHSLTKSIIKSKIYFDDKVKAEKELQVKEIRLFFIWNKNLMVFFRNKNVELKMYKKQLYKLKECIVQH